MGKISDRLEELGLELPEVSPPLAEYVPAKRVGDMLYVSGQVPVRDGEFLHVGVVGDDLSVEEGAECARLCALNGLAAAAAAVGGVDRIAEAVQVRGYVNCGPGFGRQPEVVNGASEFLVEVLGEAGRHARAAVGAGSLPRNVPVEIEFVFRLAADE